MSFVKLDGKSEVIFIVVGVWLCDLVFSHLLSFFRPIMAHNRDVKDNTEQNLVRVASNGDADSFPKNVK